MSSQEDKHWAVQWEEATETACAVFFTTLTSTRGVGDNNVSWKLASRCV